MRTEKHSQAFECAQKILAFSNDTSILYKLPKDSFEFFAGSFLPCLLGSSIKGKAASWKTSGFDDPKKLLAFLARVEKLGGLCGTFDDIPAIHEDHDFFLLFFAWLRLKKEEEEKTKKEKIVNQSRKVRLQKIETILAEFPERIFKGFSNDKEPSRQRGRKPSKPVPLNYVRLEQVLMEYYDREPQSPPPPPRPSRHRGLGFFLLFLFFVAIGIVVYFMTAGRGNTDTPPQGKTPIGQAADPVPGNTQERNHIVSQDVRQDNPAVYQGKISQYHVKSVIYQVIDGLTLDHIHSSSDSDASFAIFKLNGKTSVILEIGETFEYENIEWRLADIDVDGKTQDGIAYIEEIGNPVRIACLPNQPVRLPRKAVLINDQTGTTVSASTGSTFKLASAETGEVEYKVISVNLAASQVVVESNSANHETYTITPKTSGKDIIPVETGTHIADQQNGEAPRGPAESGPSIGHGTPDRNGDSGSADSGSAPGSDSQQETAQTELRQEDEDKSQEPDFHLELKEILKQESNIAVEPILIEPGRISADGSMLVLPFDANRPDPSARKNTLRNDPFTMDVAKLFSAQNLNAIIQSAIGKDKTVIMKSADDDYQKTMTGSAGTLDRIQNGEYTVCRFSVAIRIKSYHEEHTLKNYSSSPGSTEYLNFTVRGKMEIDLRIYDRVSEEAYETELVVRSGERSYSGAMKLNYTDYTYKKDWASVNFISDRKPFFDDFGNAIHDYLMNELHEAAQAAQEAEQAAQEAEQAAQEAQAGSAAGTGAPAKKTMDPRMKQKQEALQHEFTQSLNREMEKQARIVLCGVNLENETIPATGFALSMSNPRSGLRQDVKGISISPAIPGFTTVQDDPDAAQGDAPCSLIWQAAIDKVGSNSSKAAPRVLAPADDDFEALCEIYDNEEAVDSLYATRLKIESSQYMICRYEVAITVKSYEEQHVFKEFSVGRMDFVVRSKITIDLEVYDRVGRGRYFINDLLLTSEDKPHSVGTQRSLTDFTSSGSITTENIVIDRRSIFEDLGKKINAYLRSNRFIQAIHP